MHEHPVPSHVFLDIHHMANGICMSSFLVLFAVHNRHTHSRNQLRRRQEYRRIAMYILRRAQRATSVQERPIRPARASRFRRYGV